jgi:hypothetical protein
LFVATKVTPAFGDNGSNSSCPDSAQQHAGEFVRMLEHYTAKADVDRRRAIVQKGLQVRVRGVFGWTAEEEATDVY